MKKPKKYRLCIYLIKENYNDAESIAKDSSALESYSFKNKSKKEIILFVKKSKPSIPHWIELFVNVLDTKIKDSFNSSSAAVLIVKYKDRYFAFTFGYGRNLLNLDCVEESFGLRVALNSINPDKVRSIDIENIDTVIRHAKVQTSQAGSVDDFGMNIERDILNAVTGKSNVEFLGKTITGSTAVYLNFPLDINNMGELCSKLLEKYFDDSYKNNFPFVDNISEIKIASLIDRLNKELINTIKNRDFEHLFLAIPEVVNWDQFEGFKYKESDELKEDIFVEDVLPSDNKDELEINLNFLKGKEVLFIGRDDQIFHRWALYKCVNYELKKEKETYILTSGKWFKVNIDYANSVDKDLEEVNEYEKFNFPKYTEKKEEEYNKNVCQDNEEKCFLMDRKIIRYGGGRSSIEFCDLIINKTDFIHVKRFRGSSALSHLFFQGANSARLFLSASAFRKEVNKLLPAQWNFRDPIEPSDYEVVFAIISKAKEKVKDLLPFFSKISFLQIYNQLRLYRYKVSLSKIEM